MRTRNRGAQLAMVFVMIGVAATGIIWFWSNDGLVEENASGIGVHEPHPVADIGTQHMSESFNGTERETAGDTEPQHSEKSDALVPLPTNEPLPYRIRHAVTYGAEGKITVRVVDTQGGAVKGAEVSGGFYNSTKPIFEFKETTDDAGRATITGTCSGDANIRVLKNGFYKSNVRYWFFKNYFDCVKDGRWIPWDPTVEITLKEIRDPIPLYTRHVNASFPKQEKVGFDCMVNDFVSPFGEGENPDFYLTYESIKPVNAITIRDWSFLTNSLVLSASPGGGFITKQKDSFSKLVSDYEAPEMGYVDIISYEMKRTTDKIFVDRKLGDGEYLFFKSRVRQKTGGGEDAHYGKIYRLVFGESLKETNSATLKISYYLNPTPDDRNLEFDGKNNLFKPGWKDTDWPRDP